jgi:hypothetical protein
MIGDDHAEIVFGAERAHTIFDNRGKLVLLQARTRILVQGFDAGLWLIGSGSAHGCLIWHIDETRISDNTANSNPARRLVDVEEADGPPQDMDLANGESDAGDPWPGISNDTAFDNPDA